MTQPYRLTCDGGIGYERHFLVTDLDDFDTAISAMLDEQQRPWTSVTLTPLAADAVPLVGLKDTRMLAVGGWLRKRGGV